MNELNELFINISDSILVGASKDALAKIEEYDNKVLKYDDATKFGFTTSQSNNIFTSSAKNVNIGKISNLSTNLSFDIDIMYFVEDEILTNINIKLKNISENDTYESMLYNFYNIFCSSMFISTLLVIDNESISLDSNNNIGIIISNSMNIVLKMAKDEGFPVSVFNIFSNTLPVKYSLNTSSGIGTEIARYSSDLKSKYDTFVKNEGSLVNNMQDIDTPITIDTDAFAKDFSEIKNIKTIGDEYYNIIVNSVNRSGNMSVSEILTIFEHSNKFSIKTIEHEVTKGKK